MSSEHSNKFFFLNRMNKNMSDDFCLAIRPLLYVSRALGLAPFAYVKKPLPGGKLLEKLEISSFALIYSVFFVVLYVCMLAVCFTFKYMYIYSLLSPTDIVTEISLHAVSTSSLVSLALSVTKNRNSCVRITSLTAETDRFILTSSTEYYRKATICLFVQVLVMLAVFGLFSLYEYITWYPFIGAITLSYCHIYIDNLIEWIVVIHFVNMVVLLKNRYFLLNTRLINLSGVFELQNTKEGFNLPSLETACVRVKEMKSRITGKEILTFNKIHDMLFDIVILVKSTYEVQIFLSLLSAFASMTIWSYYGLCVLYGFFSPEHEAVSKSRVLLTVINWSFLHMAKLLCITIPCHSANNSMAHTSTVLRKLLLAFHSDPATMSELERFSQHVALRKFKFTVFGFLNLDLSLLVSMTGAVVTYLVILIQFKMASSS